MTTKPRVKVETVKTWTIVVLASAIMIATSYGLGTLNGVQMELQKNKDITTKAQALAQKTPLSKQ